MNVQYYNWITILIVPFNKLKVVIIAPAECYIALKMVNLKLQL